VNDFSCRQPTYDCRVSPDGGAPVKDAEWRMFCEDSTTVITDGGSDAGSDGGTTDGGTTDGGVDGGP